MRMLSHLKERVLAVHAIADVEKLLKMAQLMPHEANQETLKEISVRSAARTIVDQGLNVESELENIPLELRELVLIYYQGLQNEQTITFKSLL